MGAGLITIGVAMSCASSILFNIRLTQFKAFLKEKCPGIWEVHGPRLENPGALLRYKRLRQIPLEFESDNEIVNQKLRSLAFIYKSTVAGIFIIFIGVFFEIYGVLNV